MSAGTRNTYLPELKKYLSWLEQERGIKQEVNSSVINPLNTLIVHDLIFFQNLVSIHRPSELHLAPDFKTYLASSKIAVSPHVKGNALCALSALCKVSFDFLTRNQPYLFKDD